MHFWKTSILTPPGRFIYWVFRFLSATFLNCPIRGPIRSCPIRGGPIRVQIRKIVATKLQVITRLQQMSLNLLLRLLLLYLATLQLFHQSLVNIYKEEM